MAVLLAALVSASFMAGLSWFVGAVHYPLFDGVGGAGWAAYHRRHSDRMHGGLGDGLDARVHRTLLRTHHARTLLWSAHAGVAALMVAATAA